MQIQQRIAKLRQSMRENKLDAYIIPSSDPHMSEYVAPHWQGRKWISGFTGSAGTVVITEKEAGLWTDGRYHVQALEQLEGTGIDLFKGGVPGVPTYSEWLSKNLADGSIVGMCGDVFSVSQLREVKKQLQKQHATVKQDMDLLADIWDDRPAIPANPIFEHELVYAGKSVSEKLEMVRKELADTDANWHLITALDDIAWLFNIRGSDMLYTPIAYAYALVCTNSAVLFIDQAKVPEALAASLTQSGVTMEPYPQIRTYLGDLTSDDTIRFDPNGANALLFDAISTHCTKIEEKSIPSKLKAIRNSVEIENLKQAHIQDGVAMVQFLFWLEQTIPDGDITEITIAKQLEEFRSRQENYMGPSFATIAAYKDHAAMMHYQATTDNYYTIHPEGMLLVDSGGQYLSGTTDITRTIILGPISEQQKRDFTLVLKGHINLARAKFLEATTGSNLDVLARQPLWQEGINYRCGTGHGIGYFLGVHEGPQGMSQTPSTVQLKPGMILTNEPGVYQDGEYGIRTENEMLIVTDQKTEYGQFYRFEIITYCPIDITGIVLELLTNEEKTWLNTYHEKVYAKLSPYLDADEKAFLKRKTQAI